MTLRPPSCRRPASHGALLAVTLAAATAFAAAPLAAQTPPMPEDSTLRAGFLAWDEGDYPAALRAYLEVLNGPEGSEHLEEVALLTGELYQVRELAPDGRAIRMAPNGRMATFEVTANDRVVTKVVDLATGSVVATLEGTGAVFGADGSIAYARVEETPALVAARQAEREARFADDDEARDRARVAVRWDEARARTTYVWRGGSSEELDAGDLLVFGVYSSPQPGEWLVVGARGADVVAGPGNDEAAAIYALSDSGAEPLPMRGAPEGALLATDGFVVYESEDGLVLIDREAGAPFAYDGATDATLSADGSTLAFLTEAGGLTRVEAMDLRAGGAPSARVIAESDRPISRPAASPDGAWVAYEKMAYDDWEIFAAATDGSGETQLSLEIQHDRYPMWIDASHVLAAKGEGRHMRSFIYDFQGSPPLKLFHNNTVRTIAPEYEWAASRDGSKILIVSERDGDTVSPERGVYLVDRTAKVTLADVRTRLERSLAAEEDLRRRGEAAFAPIADEVAAVADAVSVSRIYESARDVYGFGSKHITQPGNALAIAYYEQALRAFGYEPELQWFEPRPGIRSANIVVRIPGTVDPELVYVASSHFDSVERGPGADDDSSGATALLEAARVLKDHPMPATIELAFFTGEEAGLLGSREYVRRAQASGKRIVGALNNDMIGWANSHRLDNTIRYSNPGIRDIQHAAAMQFSDLITYDALYYKSTDAAAYYEAYGDIVGGIGSYPVLGNPHYHQATDRLETINQRLVAQVSKTTAATLMLLASSPSRLTGLVVDGETARWEPSPETGVSGYEVRWQTADGWRTVEVGEPTAELDGLAEDGMVRVRAVHERGTVGWDWAAVRAGG